MLYYRSYGFKHLYFCSYMWSIRNFWFTGLSNVLLHVLSFYNIYAKHTEHNIIKSIYFLRI